MLNFGKCTACVVSFPLCSFFLLLLLLFLLLSPSFSIHGRARIPPLESHSGAYLRMWARV